MSLVGKRHPGMIRASQRVGTTENDMSNKKSTAKKAAPKKTNNLAADLAKGRKPAVDAFKDAVRKMKTNPRPTMVPLEDQKREAVEAEKTPENPGKKVRSPRAPAAAKEPKAVDPRLPPVGTKIEKKDRNGTVRCTCKVLDGGRIEYDGKEFASISAAALAAAKDLGLTNKTYNGFTFWGLDTAKRPAKDPVEGLNAAWAKFEAAFCRANVAATDANRDEIRRLLRTFGNATIDAAKDAA